MMQLMISKGFAAGLGQESDYAKIDKEYLRQQ